MKTRERIAATASKRDEQEPLRNFLTNLSIFPDHDL
jgi:hypothetical protein